MADLIYKGWKIFTSDAFQGVEAEPVKGLGKNEAAQWFQTVKEAKEWIDNMEIFNSH